MPIKAQGDLPVSHSRSMPGFYFALTGKAPPCRPYFPVTTIERKIP